MHRKASFSLVLVTAAAILMATVGIVSCVPANGQSKKTAGSRLTEAEAISLQRRLFDGMIAHDLTALGAIIDEHVIYIHIGGEKQNSREEFLSWVNTGPKFKTFELTDPKVFIFDGAMALTGRVESVSNVVSKAPNGAEQTRETVLHLVLSTVWAQKPAGWQLVLLQYTQIPDKK